MGRGNGSGIVGSGIVGSGSNIIILFLTASPAAAAWDHAMVVSKLRHHSNANSTKRPTDKPAGMSAATTRGFAEKRATPPCRAK
jgi:hypothetical protein